MTDKQNKQEKIEELLMMWLDSYNSAEITEAGYMENELVKIVVEEVEKTRQEAFKAGQQQSLDWVEKDVIGEGEDNSKSTFSSNPDIAFGISARNELREHQRRLIKQRNK